MSEIHSEVLQFFSVLLVEHSSIRVWNIHVVKWSDWSRWIGLGTKLKSKNKFMSEPAVFDYIKMKAFASCEANTQNKTMKNWARASIEQIFKTIFHLKLHQCSNAPNRAGTVYRYPNASDWIFVFHSILCAVFGRITTNNAFELNLFC